MALPATDNFTTGTSQNLEAYSANWTSQAGLLWIEEWQDAVSPKASGDYSYYYWNADAFNDNQYSEGVIKTLGPGFDIGIACRVDTGTDDDCYGYFDDSTGATLFKMVADAFTQLGNTGDAWATSDVVRLEVSGTTITPIVNASTDSSIGAQTDGSIGAGSAGLSGFGWDSGSTIDDWEGGNLGGGSASESASESASGSASISPSASESASGSVSASASESMSASASPSAPPLTEGEVCWGHDTGVLEANVRDFSGNWTGTGSIEGAGDAEIIALNAGENMVSEVVYTDTIICEVLQNEYDPTGDDVTLEYRHGATEGACEVAGWNAYIVPFASDGYVQIRITSTL